LWEEMEFILSDDAHYEVQFWEMDPQPRIVIKAIDNWGFHIARIMGHIIGKIMVYGKLEIEARWVESDDDPTDDKIVLDFEIYASYRDLYYKGRIEVVMK